MEIYMRLNSDLERDYAFQVNDEDTINLKLKPLFDEQNGLAKYMVLRPSIFFKSKPHKFYKSVHPGFLTENGCLLFDYDADEKPYVEELDVNKPISEQLWPGQLVLPKFEKSWTAIVTYVLIMIGWLYTDLPDVISPTPGICLTNQITKAVIIVIGKLGHEDVVERLTAEIYETTGLLAQWLFFAIHILKIMFITFFFVTGMINPISFNPVKVYATRSIFTGKENEHLTKILRSVGWVGVKRATYDNYKETYYKYVIERAGGTVPAYRAGILKDALNPGVMLGAGEGFQSPIKDRAINKTFEIMEESHKFVLSEEYFSELEQNLKRNVETCKEDMSKINAEIARFRKFGLFESGEKLSKLVQQRKEVTPSSKLPKEVLKSQKKQN
ncbi:HFL264Wp [Eremothecium sinecaudum]|uniref:HFL264Wp n=1 Tax=Eremothecium sinecaudum TaxID=45286 RepID=A0A0X8HU70_9SACH|nr:HFL264Wp [Eremothecium sinecaudum]AMD21592.1 HFL264Wp [Eremothecium sinecaudum]